MTTSLDPRYAEIESFILEEREAEARALLYTMLEDALAQKILDRLNQANPPSEDEILSQARGMIAEKRHTAAYYLLAQIPNHPLARTTLPRLHDLLAGQTPRPVPMKTDSQEMPEPSLEFADGYDGRGVSPFQERLGVWVRSGILKGVVMLIVGIIGVIYIYSFVGFPWITLDFDDSTTLARYPAADNYAETMQGDATPLEIFLGWRNNANYSLNLDAVARHEGGLGNVRLADRTLIFIPLMGAALLGLAWEFYVTSGQASVGYGLGIIFVALLLGIYPYFWQMVGEGEWSDNLDSVRNDRLTFQDRAGIIEPSVIVISNPAQAAGYLTEMQAALEDGYRMDYMVYLSVVLALLMAGATGLVWFEDRGAFGRPPAA